HLLSQIAWDGSQKIPIRLLGSLSEALGRGADVSRFGVPIAAWIRFIRHKAQRNEAITDPMATELIDLGGRLTDTAEDVKVVLALRSIFPEILGTDPRVIEAVESAYNDLLAAEE